MRLWTIQPICVYDIVQKNNIFRCEREKAIERFDLWDECFKEAYDWLVKIMKEKIKPPKDIQYPIWAWHTYDGKRKHSDLRARQGNRGEKMVCMELDVPDKEVLLSDFDAWHFVLNDFYFGNCHNDEEYERESEWFDALDKQEKIRVKEESWNKIFNLEKYDNDWYRNGYYIQACFWELKKEYIKKVKFFNSK